MGREDWLQLVWNPRPLNTNSRALLMTHTCICNRLNKFIFVIHNVSLKKNIKDNRTEVGLNKHDPKTPELHLKKFHNAWLTLPIYPPLLGQLSTNEIQILPLFKSFKLKLHGGQNFRSDFFFCWRDRSSRTCVSCECRAIERRDNKHTS